MGGMATLSDADAGRDLVRRGVPAVEGGLVRVLGTGQFSNAFLVEDRVVRVPKSQLAVDGLRREVAFLAADRDQLQGLTPLVLEAELGAGPDGAFVVHRRIPGDVLSEAWLAERAPTSSSGSPQRWHSSCNRSGRFIPHK